MKCILSSLFEAVIEFSSHRDDCASRLVSSFVVGDGNDEPKSQRKEKHLRSFLDASSGAQRLKVAILDRIFGSFDLFPAVVRLV